VTHKGASADGGHYIGWVKKDAIDSSLASGPGLSSSKPREDYDDPKDEWYKFDDDRVSIVNKEKILNLDGGGEDSTAYILLYRYVVSFNMLFLGFVLAENTRNYAGVNP
jgi:ubiquitin carboxyl-terminal hydrolase 14